MRSCYLQLDADSADETLLNQALKCIVFLALPLYEQDAAHDLIPPVVSSEQSPTPGRPPRANGSSASELNPNEDQAADGEAASEAAESTSQPAGRHQDDASQKPNGLHATNGGISAEDDVSEEEHDDDDNHEPDEDGEDDSDEADPEHLERFREESWVQGAFTLAGLVRRMTSLACDR